MPKQSSMMIFIPCTYTVVSVVSDCCLTTIEQFPAISWWELATLQLYFVLDQQLECYSAILLKQQSVDRHVASSELISLIPRQLVFDLTP